MPKSAAQRGTMVQLDVIFENHTSHNADSSLMNPRRYFTGVVEYFIGLLPTYLLLEIFFDLYTAFSTEVTTTKSLKKLMPHG